MATQSAVAWSELIGQVPVALYVEGQPVEPESRRETPDGVTYHYAGGLAAVGHKVSSSAGVEWFWQLENQGASPSPRVTAFFPLNLTFPCQGRRVPTLHGSAGGLDDANFPPTSWTQWHCACVTEGLAGGFRASSAGGRSNNRHLPFFMLENAERTGGLALGIGWSGDWHLQMRRKAETVTIQGGMTNLGLRILDGQRVLAHQIVRCAAHSVGRGARADADQTIAGVDTH